MLALALGVLSPLEQRTRHAVATSALCHTRARLLDPRAPCWCPAGAACRAPGGRHERGTMSRQKLSELLTKRNPEVIDVDAMVRQPPAAALRVRSACMTRVGPHAPWRRTRARAACRRSTRARSSAKRLRHRTSSQATTCCGEWLRAPKAAVCHCSCGRNRRAAFTEMPSTRLPL